MDLREIIKCSMQTWVPNIPILLLKYLMVYKRILVPFAYHNLALLHGCCHISCHTLQRSQNPSPET